MNEHLSPAQISMWFRDRAKLFNKIADTVDDTFRSAPSDLNGHTKPPINQGTFPGMATVTKQQVQTALESKSRRVADLAKLFKVDRGEIEEIVKDQEVFTAGDMGWISLKK